MPLTERTEYTFIICSIIYGGIEVLEKLFFPIPFFYIADIIGVSCIVGLSTLFLIWEIHRVTLTYYPSIVTLTDLGGNYYGIESEQLGMTAPNEGKLIITLRRRGHSRRLITLRRLTIRTRDGIEVTYAGGTIVQLRYNTNEDIRSDGYITRNFSFDNIRMGERILNFFFWVRCQKSPHDATEQVAFFAHPDISFTLEYGFGLINQVDAREYAEASAN